MKVLTEMLSLAMPKVFERSRCLREDIKLLAKQLGIGSTWDLEVSAMLSQIGLVAIPPEVVLKARIGQNLSAAEKLMLERVPEIGHGLLSKIPRMENVAKSVLYQNKAFDGTGLPSDGVSGQRIPRGARLLKLLNDLAKIEAKGIPRVAALEVLRSHAGQHDPEVLDAALRCFDPTAHPSEETENPPLPVTFKQLQVGWILAANVETPDGSLIVCAGNEVTPMLMERLRNFASTFGLSEPLYVHAPQTTPAAPSTPAPVEAAA